MFQLLCILNLLILVTSNPLQGLTTCPVLLYQRQPEESTQVLKFNPYQQEHTIQNQLPSYQTIPYLYNDQIGGLYLNKVLTKPTINSIVDPNTGLYNQNGYKIIRYITNPGAQPNVVNNYIIVPPEYLKLNQSTANVYMKVNDHKGNVKSKREDRKPTINDSETKRFEDRNHDSMTIKSQDNKVKKKKRKSSNNDKAVEYPATVEDSTDLRSKTHRMQRNLDIENDEENSTRKGDEKPIRTRNKKSKRKRKHKSKKPVEEPQCNELPEETKSNDSPKEVIKSIADEEVGFDIYEDCECLANRRTRNNCCQCQRNKHQQSYPRDFTENIVSYLNNLMSNPQFAANYFNPYGNFPYNFNYMNQMPQPMKTNELNKRCKSKRKKQKSNKNDSNTITVKPRKQNQDQAITSNCEKVVELEPQFVEVEEVKEPSIHIEKEEIVKSLGHQDEVLEETEEKELEISQNVAEGPEITEPVVLYADDESEENVYVPVSEEVAPFPNYKDIYDDYYPDFTLDNIYLSKEEDDCDNFHDRHYYTSDSKAEMSRERRRYERVDGKKLRTPNDIFNDEQDSKYTKNEKLKQRKGKVKNLENTPEIIFRVPPPLEFPDFRTEMVNKDRFIPRNEIYYNPGDIYENHGNIERYYGDVKPFYLDVNKGHDNEVETVCAHSKVVRYGAKPIEEETSSVFDFTEIKKDDRNLFSTDGQTTVILARSMGYPEDYL